MLSYQNSNIESNLNILTSHHVGAEKEMIEKAFNYARSKHEGQFRNSGEPYIHHPVKVALKLNEMKADYETICAALLHDIIEDCDTSKEEIEREFSPTIANLVDGVTKVSATNSQDKEAKDIQTINKLILSMEDDVRIIIIKLADRLHNMETIQGHNSVEKRNRIARQTLDVYAPIAALLGLQQLKEELEDISFKTLWNKEYNTVSDSKMELIDSNKELSRALFSLQYPYSETSLYKLLESADVPVLDIKLKYKSLFSIYRKLILNKKSDISQITDLVTYRITTANEETSKLYIAMGKVNEVYKMLNGNQYAMRDYVSFPKTDLYKGLLTYNILETPNETLQIHFQYQTPKMLNMSIYGIASFWNYDDLEKVNEMQAFLEKMPIYTDLSKLCSEYKNNEYSYEEFFYKINKLIFSRRIYVKMDKFIFKQTYEGITLEDFILSLDDGFIDLHKDYYINGKKQSGKYIMHNNDYLEIIDKKDENIFTNIFGGIQRKRK